jgi:hypothetical protein
MESPNLVAEVISLIDQIILFALKENVIPRRSKPEDPSTESNPHRLDFPLITLDDITRKTKQFLTCTQKKPQEQSLSDYAQQDISKMMKRSPRDMQKALNKTNNSYAY